MTESDKASQVVVDGKAAKPRKSRWPKFKSKKSKIIVAILLLLVIVAVAGGYMWKRHNDRKFVTIDGKKYKVDIVTSADKIDSTTKVTDEQFKAELVKQLTVVASAPTPHNYIALAQLYYATGDKTKAIQSYQKAKTLIDPNNEDHKNLDKLIDMRIDNINSEQQQ